MKVVINDCYGGFGLSRRAARAYWKRKGVDVWFYSAARFIGPWERIDDDDRVLFGWWIVTQDYGPKVKRTDIDSHTVVVTRDIPRHDPDLVAVVEVMGEAANTDVSRLKVIEIPDDVQYEIEENNGNEWVAEMHRVWY